MATIAAQLFIIRIERFPGTAKDLLGIVDLAITVIEDDR